MLTFKEALRAQRFTELFGNDGCCFGSPLPERYRGYNRNKRHNQRSEKLKTGKKRRVLKIHHDKKSGEVTFSFSATKPNRKRPMAIRASQKVR